MTQALKQPYMSIVVVVRNDNYGGNFTQRFQHALDSLSRQTALYQTEVELVLVDYNPVPAHPAFHEMVRWPVANQYLRIKTVTVPAGVHTQVLNDGTERLTLPVLEFIAKNVGIRRASGEFILSTNADIVFDDHFFAVLRKKNLDRQSFYRCNRFDFSPDGKDDNKRTIKKIYIRHGQYRKPRHMPFPVFWVLARMLGLAVRGYSLFISRFGFLRAYRHKVLFVPKEELFLLKYHLHASGDFMLMARDGWSQLHGYPENTFSAMHTDSLLVLAAVALGLKEKVFGFPVYHQEHRNNFEHNAPDFYKDTMFLRLVEDAGRMSETGEPIIANGEGWGMAGLDLPVR